MYTYQDLLKVADDKDKKIKFVLSAISQHKSSDDYQTALTAEEYAKRRNTTIVKFQKLLYTVTGKVVPDNFSANYKLCSGFFKRFTIQQSQYLLGNGVSWKNDTTSDSLGTKKYPFDNQIQKAGKYALIEKVSFCYWNLDHIEVFKFTEFVPFFDEKDGALKAGIRFWRIAEDKPLRATLYEMDGYTEILFQNGKDYEILQEKRGYVANIGESESDGIEIYDYESYPSFPIVPFWANQEHQSELVGLQEQIDCYDLIKSGFANDVDDASQIYWIIQNAGGMDDVDLVKFVERMKTVKAAVVEDDGARAEAHTMDVPYESRERLLDRLEKDLYKDYMALNTENIANGAVTATQIKASYEPINNKADEWEYCAINCINGILELAGIEDIPSFTRSIIVNATENIQSVLQSAQYLSNDYVTRKILDYLGDGDKAEDMISQMEKDDLDRFNALNTSNEGEDDDLNEEPRE